MHVPLIMHWPARISSRGTGTGTETGTENLRDQFHHVNDIVPTIYEALGVAAPATYRGREQMPITGTSMLSTFDAPNAVQPAAFGGAAIKGDTLEVMLPAKSVVVLALK